MGSGQELVLNWVVLLKWVVVYRKECLEVIGLLVLRIARLSRLYFLSGHLPLQMTTNTL